MLTSHSLAGSHWVPTDRTIVSESTHRLACVYVCTCRSDTISSHRPTTDKAANKYDNNHNNKVYNNNNTANNINIKINISGSSQQQCAWCLSGRTSRCKQASMLNRVWLAGDQPQFPKDWLARWSQLVTHCCLRHNFPPCSRRRWG